jgi:hypothetical protein
VVSIFFGDLSRKTVGLFVYTRDMPARKTRRDPDGLELVGALLREERPLPSDEQLDRAWRRIQPASPAPRREPLMRFRLAVSALLAIGVLMSGGGAALALSGSSSQGQAAEVVYPPPANTVVGGQTNVQAQAPRQAAVAGEREIPFTGFAAIPVIGLGVVLLVAGVVLRRRSAVRQN